MTPQSKNIDKLDKAALSQLKTFHFGSNEVMKLVRYTDPVRVQTKSIKTTLHLAQQRAFEVKKWLEDNSMAKRIVVEASSPAQETRGLKQADKLLRKVDIYKY